MNSPANEMRMLNQLQAIWSLESPLVDVNKIIILTRQLKFQSSQLARIGAARKLIPVMRRPLKNRVDRVLDPDDIIVFS